ncbi:secretion-regulating guanine nucleotide exchange factor-like [Macrosteles quadrilineatus]|uniref:secretion-regulating guanine nucleotide exchange factor-like n=1 Tax=Macrosteles quadrilineatus TaxID=74068 RepID=UPI0023E217B6|nr:secretion-regulating guanine nucleotide exchange factor-like [Macrosteles quadrilineatus]
MKLFSWGANSYGQLGHGIQSEQCLYPTEAKIPDGFDDIVKIEAGGGHTIAQDSGGNVFGAGSNSHGQLADCANNTVVLSKMRSLGEMRVTDVTCGWESSYFTVNGQLIVLGSNKAGQLGISKSKVLTTSHPVVLPMQNVAQVSAGLRHAALVTQAGHVLVCGTGKRGQLGILGEDSKVPTKDCDSWERVASLEGVVQVACGQHHTLALTSDGRLLGWGDNRRGQLGEGTSLIPTPQLITTADDADVVIRAGWTHSAMVSGGRVRSWGRNCYNQLGHSCGQDQVADVNQLISLQGVKQLELGSEHNLALLENGEVWSWGWNEHGNCGTGTIDNVVNPQKICLPHPAFSISAGGGHSLALCAA